MKVKDSSFTCRELSWVYRKCLQDCIVTANIKIDIIRIMINEVWILDVWRPNRIVFCRSFGKKNRIFQEKLCRSFRKPLSTNPVQIPCSMSSSLGSCYFCRLNICMIKVIKWLTQKQIIYIGRKRFTARLENLPCTSIKKCARCIYSLYPVGPIFFNPGVALTYSTPYTLLGISPTFK